MKYRSLKRYRYQLMEPYEHTVATGDASWETPFLTLLDGELLISKGYVWDGPSGPTIDTKSFMRGSLVHDALYQLLREGAIGQELREYADRLLREMCLADGMSRFRAWYVWKSLRWFGGRAARQK